MLAYSRIPQRSPDLVKHPRDMLIEERAGLGSELMEHQDTAEATGFRSRVWCVSFAPQSGEEETPTVKKLQCLPDLLVEEGLAKDGPR